MGQIECAVDQTCMAVDLRKVTQHAAGQRIEFFGEQANIIASVTAIARRAFWPPHVDLQDVVVDEPEAAHQEGAFPYWQTIVGLVLVVTAERILRSNVGAPKGGQLPLAPFLCPLARDQTCQGNLCSEALDEGNPLVRIDADLVAKPVAESPDD